MFGFRSTAALRGASQPTLHVVVLLAVQVKSIASTSALDVLYINEVLYIDWKYFKCLEEYLAKLMLLSMGVIIKIG
jgi:hypothetical protein